MAAMAPPHLVYLRRHSLGLVDGRSLAKAAGIGRADADRIVRSKVPQAISLTKTRDGARRMIDRLAAQGLEAFHVTQEELALFRPLILEHATRDESGIAWEGPGCWIGPGTEVRMIIVGRLQGESIGTPKPAPASRLRVRRGRRVPPPTPDPAPRRVSAGPVEEGFCCLVQDVRTASMFLESRFDYEKSLPKLAGTRSGNFKLAVELAKQAFPMSGFDERLYRFVQPSRNLAHGNAPVVQGLRHPSFGPSTGLTSQREMALSCLVYLETYGPGA